MVPDTLEMTAIERPKETFAESNHSFSSRRVDAERAGSTSSACFHCGEACRVEPDSALFASGEKLFCCQGCLLVHELLAENGLSQFYELSAHPGVKMAQAKQSDDWAFLDDATIQTQLLDFTD